MTFTPTEEFETIARKVKQLGSVSQIDQLRLYGLYKQTKVGDIDTPEPWSKKTPAGHMWNAWSAEKGKSREEAQEEYIKLARVLGAE